MFAPIRLAPSAAFGRLFFVAMTARLAELGGFTNIATRLIGYPRLVCFLKATETVNRGRRSDS